MIEYWALARSSLQKRATNPNPALKRSDLVQVCVGKSAFQSVASFCIDKSGVKKLSLICASMA